MKSTLKIVLALVLLAVACTGQETVTATCVFLESSAGYTCSLQPFVIENQDQTLEIVGDHVDGFTHQDVTRVYFTSGTNISHVLTEIFVAFENLVDFSMLSIGLPLIQSGAFSDAGNLIVLSINDNLLTELENDTFATLPRLAHLDLGQNLIQTIHPNAFNTLVSLENLYLGNNRLQNLHADTFNQLPVLRSIFLNINPLRTIEGRLFANNPRLQQVFMYSSEVHAIGSDFLDNLEQLSIIDLRENDCIDAAFSIDEDNTIDMIRPRFSQCFENFHDNNDTKTFVIELRGSLILRDENGNIVVEL